MGGRSAYIRGEPGAVELAERAYGESKECSRGFSRSVTRGSGTPLMPLRAFTSNGGADGGGMSPGSPTLSPLALGPSCWRAFSFGWRGGLCDVDLWWAAAAWERMTCLKRDDDDGSFGCSQ